MKSVITIIAATVIALWTCGNVQAVPPDVTYRSPTPDDGATVTEPTVQIEASIVEAALVDVTFNWDGTDCAIYDDSLVLMFNFDNVPALGEDYESHPEYGVADLSGRGNHGILSATPGIPAWIAGKYGGAFDFTGNGVDSGQSILVQHSDSLNPGSGDFAIAVWILTRDDVDGDILRKGSTNTTDPDAWYKLEHSPSPNNNKLSLNFNTDGTDATVTSAAAYNDEQWHFVVAQRNGSQAQLWIDGELDGSASISGSISNTANLAVGSKDTQGDDFINSSLDEVRIYMRSFSADEVQLLYDSNLSKYKASTTDPTEWTLNVTRDGLENDDYIYAVSATNLSGTTTNQRTVTIALPVPPDVTLVSPANGSVLNNPIVTFTVGATDSVGLVDATLYIGTPEQIATFSGPAETHDAQISADQPDTNYGSGTSINVDGLTPHAHAVIKFPNVIGIGPEQVPSGAIVVSATLQVNCTNLGAMMQVYRLTSDWAEENVTWNSPWDNPGGDYDPAIVVNGDCTATGLRTIDITEFVQAWADGTANYGILLTDTGGTDGVDFDSSEGGNPPLLTVVYAGDWQALDTQEMSGTSGTATFANVVLQDMTDYVWNCLVTNAADPPMSSWAPENFYLSIDGQTPDEPLLVGPADGATGVTIPATLEVTVSDPQTDVLDVTFYGRKKVAGAEDFTIVVLPDTQKYAESYPDIFTSQTQWIIDNKDALNIVFVTHEGDIVQTWNSTTQWDRANTSMSLLDGIVPYGLAPGDHDHYGEDPPGSTEYYEQKFPASRFAGYSYWGGSYAGNFGGSYDETYPHTNNNNYQLLTIGGQDYIFVHLDFCPSQDEMDWANGILTTYSERKAILTTHGLLDTNANYYGSGDFWLYPDGSSNPTNDTSLIWYDLIRNHENLQLVLCGHMHGEARRTDDNLFGKPVHQLLANYQGRTNGGNGWLRIMRFVPAENKIYVQTYSPWLNQYETDAGSQFELDVPLNWYAEIGTNLDVANGSNTSVVWTELAEQTEYEWYVTVTDSTGRTSVGPDWSFTSAMATQPVADAGPDQTVADSDGDNVETVTLDGSASSDPDGEITTYEWKEGSNVLGNTVSITMEFTVGTHTITLTVTDDEGTPDTDDVIITVNANQAPLADAGSDQTLTDSDENGSETVTLDGSASSDPDGTILSYEWDIDGDQVTDYTGETVLDVQLGVGVHNITLTVTDNGGATASDDVTVTITQPDYDAYVSQSPIVTYGLVEGGIAGTTTAVDGLVQTITEVTNAAKAVLQVEYVLTTNADPTSISSLQLYLDATWTDVSEGGDNLSVQIWNGSGWTDTDITGDMGGSFTPAYPQDYVDAGGNIRVLFTDTVAVKREIKDVLTIDRLYADISAGPVNQPPVANDDAHAVDEDDTLTVSAPGVLGNDTDPESNPLTAVLIGDVSNGMLSLNSNGSFNYTPNANFNSSDSFTYAANDGVSNSNTATVTITVNPINDAPVANNDSATTNEDTAVVIDVLANDTDVDPTDTLSVQSVTEGANGIVVVNGDNTVTYTPNAAYTGDDSFTYTISDGNGGTDTATVSITVTEFNNPPVANNDADSTNEDTDVTILVLANDTDADVDDTLSVQSATNGSNGSVVNNGDSVTYTPNANFNGTDVFTYTVSDGKGGTDTGSVTVTVLAVNDPPSAGDDSAATDEDTAVVVDVLANDSDIDGDTLTIDSVTQGVNGSVVKNGGSVTYTPDTGFTGEDSFTYIASDGNGGTAEATVTVTVDPATLSVHVDAIDVTVASAGRKYYATATVTLAPQFAGATVVGDWYFKGVVRATGQTATTDADGAATFTSFTTPGKSGDTFKFVVTNVTATDYTYDEASNVVTSGSDAI